MSLLAWLLLLMARGGYWRTDVRLPSDVPQSSVLPRLSIVVPARNEAEVLPSTLPSLLAQDYSGPLHIHIVDDVSDDETARVARSIANRAGASGRLTVVRNKPRPAGWVGKTWALRAGVQSALTYRPEFVLLTDADIHHPPDSARTLVAAAVEHDFDLVSQMARLCISAFWDRLLIPAFVLFFGMVFPFRWSNDPSTSTAAAAGGCLLVRADALAASGGIDAIADAVIDDCALARRIKDHARPQGGRTWLGHSQSVCSVRRYDGLQDIWLMVTRSAFAQLDFSNWRLVGTVVGLMVVFVLPPVAVIVGVVVLVLGASLMPSAILLGAGIAAWTLMTASHVPMSRWYGTAVVLALAQPVTAFLYTLMTLDSGRLYWLGVGARWRGREVSRG